MSSATPPLLVVDRLSRVFGSGRTLVRAVSDVSFTTRAGEITVVMGPSGSGKTTLLTVIGGLLRPTSGRVVIDGLEITALQGRQLPRIRRELVGFVFQTFNLLESLTVQENVEVALNVGGIKGQAAHKRSGQVLDRVGLAGRREFNARDLSAGEKQRVALARALANRPRLLLADEPTANLDSAGTRDVLTLFRELAELGENGVLVVSHDERVTGIADQVFTLEDGRIASVTDAVDRRSLRDVSGR
jgi:putative ABC transport system ATP-binding protein